MFSSMESYQRSITIRRETLEELKTFALWLRRLEFEKLIDLFVLKVSVCLSDILLTNCVCCHQQWEFCYKIWSWFSKYIRFCFCEIFVLRAHVQRLSWRSDVALRLQTITVLQTHTNTNSVPLWKKRFLRILSII